MPNNFWILVLVVLGCIIWTQKREGFAETVEEQLTVQPAPAVVVEESHKPELGCDGGNHTPLIGPLYHRVHHHLGEIHGIQGNPDVGPYDTNYATFGTASAAFPGATSEYCTKEHQEQGHQWFSCQVPGSTSEQMA